MKYATRHEVVILLISFNDELTFSSNDYNNVEVVIELQRRAIVTLLSSIVDAAN